MKVIMIGCICLLFFTNVNSQIHGGTFGRNLVLPIVNSSVTLQFIDSLPPELNQKFTFLMLFSSANSKLSVADIAALYEFVERGGNLYIGADNAPFSAESDQLTLAWFGKRFWGNHLDSFAERNGRQVSEQVFKEKNILPAGETTVSFPLDYRLKVELWADDEPLILSTNIGLGKIILDGGYSRFNTLLFNSSETQKMFQQVIDFLTNF